MTRLAQHLARAFASPGVEDHLDARNSGAAIDGPVLPAPEITARSACVVCLGETATEDGTRALICEACAREASQGLFKRGPFGSPDVNDRSLTDAAGNRRVRSGCEASGEIGRGTEPTNTARPSTSGFDPQYTCDRCGVSIGDIPYRWCGTCAGELAVSDPGDESDHDNTNGYAPNWYANRDDIDEPDDDYRGPFVIRWLGTALLLAAAGLVWMYVAGC